MIHWIDIETTGLNPNADEIRQISVVSAENGLVVRSMNLHIVFNYDNLEPDFIAQFGVERPDDRFVSKIEAYTIFQAYFSKYPKVVLGGKNVALFDYQWLKSWFPTKVQHRMWDIGLLFATHEHIPSLGELIERHARGAFQLHDSFDDALACWFLYENWIVSKQYYK